MMMSSMLSAELSATCNAIGYSTGTTYHVDPYAKETITDIIRYLRRDESDHAIRRHLGKGKILQMDLLPILIHHAEKEELFDVLLRLLVILTSPAMMIYEEELPSNRNERHYYLEMISHLQSYKEAFTQQRVWEILAEKLEKLLKVPHIERDDDTNRMMERILILVRNVLHVPADAEAEKRPDNDASVHDQVLWCLHQGGMVDLLLYMATSDQEQQFYLHILEILSLMLREQNPASLASAALQRSVEEKERDERELLEIRRRETLEKQSKVKKYAGTRHSRFGGTFVMKDVKSISDKDLIYHKPLNKAVDLSLAFDKQRAKVPKNKVALNYQSCERRSAFSVRLFLKEFCVEFLNGAYNHFMHKVRENLVRAIGQKNDETYYFWAIKFFMEFNRLYKFQVKLVSETMHQEIFHFVQTQIENWMEMMITDKKHIPTWSRRVHHAVQAYQELLMTLQEMDRSQDRSVRQSAKVIKSNIFYQSEYRELVIFLFNVYTDTKFSRVYLKDLVETTQIFLKMLKEFCKQYQNLVVQGKPKRRAQRKKKPAQGRRKPETGPETAEATWDRVGPELSAVLQGAAEIPTDVVPFDATSGLSMDQEKVEAMKKIKAELMQGNFEQAVGLLRASREVWPENNCFGHADMPPEEEFLAMREIFMADIGQLPAVAPAISQEENENEHEDDDEDEEDEEEGGSARDIVVPESVFKYSEFVVRFASPKVLAPICSLLETFDQNSAFTNKCIVKLLHSVAVECKMPQMLFQASLFRTFQRVFRSTNPEHKEIVRLAKFIIREFVRLSSNNQKIYMETLFWKNTKEAYDLEYGYGSSDTKSHSAKHVWSEEQEDELRRLAHEYEEKTPENEPDPVDWIMKNMINQSRSRRAVVKKLKELYLVVGSMKPKKSKEMSEEEISQLRSLYEEFKDSPDPMSNILGGLSVPRGRNAVANKLLELGLISDRKELRKKRAKKSGKSAKNLEWGERSDDESIYDSWSDDDVETSKAPDWKKKTTKARVGHPSVAQMCCQLRRTVDAGEELQGALEWLQSSLKEVLEDLEDADDQDEGTALLPLTRDHVLAMENPIFLQLLDIFSFQRPTDQEKFWRIPGTWTAEDLTKRINLVKDALEGNLPNIDPDEIEQVVQLPGIPVAKPEEEIKKTPKKKEKKSLNEFTWENSGSDSETQNKNSPGPSRGSSPGLSESSISRQGKKFEKRKSKLLVDSSGESDSDSNGLSGSSKISNKVLNENTEPSMLRKRLLRVSSESEDETSTGIDKSASSEPSRKRRVIHDDNNGRDSETTVTSRVNDSSDSEEDTITISKKKNIESESEDETSTGIDKSASSEPSRKRKAIHDDNNDRNSETTVTSRVNDSSDSEEDTITISKKKNVIESDSEDEMSTGIDKSASPEPSRKRKVIHDDKNDRDSETTGEGLTSHVNDSSDSEEDTITISKKKNVIESDSEDEKRHNSSFEVKTKERKLKRKKLSIESDSDEDDRVMNSKKKSTSFEKEKSKNENYQDENCDTLNISRMSKDNVLPHEGSSQDKDHSYRSSQESDDNVETSQKS